jgi:phosphoribosylformylglycinamidine synthase subunit PurS
MKFVAEIDIMPHSNLLDPQGKTVAKNLHSIDVHDVHDVRIGKHVRMVLEAANEAEARQKVDTACKKLLANLIMESFHYDLHVEA